MSGKYVSRVLYWLPRILAVAIILFLGIFALDVFEQGKPLWEMAAGFLIHLAPNFLLLIILIIAWKKEDTGGLLFMLVAEYMFLFFHNPFWVNMMLFGPIFLIGLLFVADEIL